MAATLSAPRALRAGAGAGARIHPQLLHLHGGERVLCRRADELPAVSYHLATTRTIDAQWIPVLLAVSTAFGVGASLALGNLYDQFGLPVVLGAAVLSSLFSPLVFFGGGFTVVLAGMLLWAIGYATQETLLKALVAGVLPEGSRNLPLACSMRAAASAGSSAAWRRIVLRAARLALVLFAIVAQLASLPSFVWGLQSQAPSR